MTDAVRRFHVSLTQVLRWYMAGVGLIFGSCLAVSAQAEEPAMYETCNPFMAQLCGIIPTHCLPYLKKPANLRPNALVPVPKTFRRYFESTLNTHVIGYEQTDMPQAMVVLIHDEPAREMLTHRSQYSEILPVYQSWRTGPGARFVATSEFEPVSKITMDRAYAATFPAAPMRDGRVTEITLDWNLSFEGLTRFCVSHQPLRDHSCDLLQVGMT